MWPESEESSKPLRTGLTTGTCATACVLAGAQALIAKREDPEAFVLLPKGQKVSQPILYYQYNADSVKTATIKDAGDDPDATHGATVWAQVRLTSEKGVSFIAGEGVGTVTRTGLVLAVGEPAVNPVPRKMMSENLSLFAENYGYDGGFELTIGVENGEQIAQKTMNPRLGIIGGLSILGTTGIVRPFSCAAYIASIHQGIDVARANHLAHIAATTGNASENAIKARHELTDMALIEMGDFVGAVLKHIRKVEKNSQLRKLSICGGFGKISKLAQHHMDLNSRVSSINLNALADTAMSLGASDALQEKMRLANTSIEALAFSSSEGLSLADAVCHQAALFCRTYIPASMELEVYAIDRKGEFVGYAKG
ncbi:cobalt-precorrin-5B (C(1))-methyltransferase [Marinomonas mediterranea]|jgi:cobalamin biosynthesis protein CbiD|uniref:Cobalt-precorrin-5B C(1)-methyltransferase n=1 Tax=Marinomonas mediterranea (strain ATCC 700492 / JCM 21426 / NBRC 103028 / MMB-1) TaxID=717774 RepID=F2JUU5_MARM1|nr:cobalt-precorrin-5B (C(1))-methyltransferase [Marinomonas mediterranea]ADZ90510.1 cobalt-precorrin-6A synthase (deacetylating) [Marinomonas mediterranea MMB-1]WCN08563.1 cobalt-precorrin-5B (C(1))-methyltransferase [Marinomonas mediterranea]WCN12617.1 cobalt-precorrin-5B (C(1))-methyltransferase [Marinomonas mediterranea]WCN16689.1 cobalt-precorrin-5B (C(1))-methyltransferase [Marinomonas mediterranea MMB-1]